MAAKDDDHHNHGSELSDMQLRVRALETVLIEQVFRDHWGRVLASLVGLLGDFDLAEEAAQEAFAVAAQRWPTDGAPANAVAWLITTARNRAIAKAWADPAFKQALLADASAAVGTLGLVSRVGDHLVAVENTERVHNMIVCTLCSCYPWEVLGLPPVWYKSAPYRSRAVIDPRGVLADFGVTLAATTDIRVWDSTAEIRYMVLPMRPAGTDGWSEARLEALVTRDSMIGTGLPKQPHEVV